MSWIFDISAAPRGRYSKTFAYPKKGDPYMVERFVPDRVILATKCGKVTLSHFIPDEGRWQMLAKGEEPVAWQPWPRYPHDAPAVVSA